ncbi:MAG: peptidylprolyl isomerase [Burkholderiaceae bacterium]|nr:MAG: peptidylprolyl isomerase [Burkholderiaceae bacterium]
MQIAADTVVTLSFELFNDKGELLDATDGPLAYLHGGYGGILESVEEALEGKKAGDRLELSLSVDDAFGPYDPELVKEEDRSAFPDDVEEDMLFEAEDPETGEAVLCRITAVDGDKVTIDANHPFAGLDVRFEIEVHEVRAATAEEIEAGDCYDDEE